MIRRESFNGASGRYRRSHYTTGCQHLLRPFTKKYLFGFDDTMQMNWTRAPEKILPWATPVTPFWWCTIKLLGPPSDDSGGIDCIFRWSLHIWTQRFNSPKGWRLLANDARRMIKDVGVNWLAVLSTIYTLDVERWRWGMSTCKKYKRPTVVIRHSLFLFVSARFQMMGT